MAALGMSKECLLVLGKGHRVVCRLLQSELAVSFSKNVIAELNQMVEEVAKVR